MRKIKNNLHGKNGIIPILNWLLIKCEQYQFFSMLINNTHTVFVLEKKAEKHKTKSKQLFRLSDKKKIENRYSFGNKFLFEISHIFLALHPISVNTKHEIQWQELTTESRTKCMLQRKQRKIVSNPKKRSDKLESQTVHTQHTQSRITCISYMHINIDRIPKVIFYVKVISLSQIRGKKNNIHRLYRLHRLKYA